jgi:hypothetical protein
LPNTHSEVHMGDPRALWIYAIAPIVRREWFGQADGVGERPVWPVMAAGIAAAVSGISLDEYGPDAIETRADDPGWLEEIRHRHQSVIAKVADHQPVVPMALVTLCSDEASVAAFLKERHDELARAIDRPARRRADVAWAKIIAPGGESADGACGHTPLTHSSRAVLPDPR